MNRKVLEIANILLFVFTIVGTNIIDILGLRVTQEQKIIVSIIVVIVYVLVVREKKWERIHSFHENTKQFNAFFEKWYKKDGHLTLFCSDLDWLDKPDAAKVVDALKRKGDKLTLFLRQELSDDKIASELVLAGATYQRIKKNIRTSHRLSMLDNDGIQSMIIRKKNLNSDDIIFIEVDSYSDPYIIGLALDVMDDCYEKNTKINFNRK